MKDDALGAFSIFFTQSPSFLSYRKSMQKTEGKNNAATLFGINDILSDNHIRNLLDEVHTNCSWFRLLKSNEKRPTKIEEKNYVPPLKNPYNHNPHKNIPESFKIFWKGV